MLSVRLRNIDEELIAMTVANPPDYEFHLTTPAGQYTIAAWDDSSGDPRVYGTAPLTVTGDIADVIIVLTPTPQVTGRILLAESGTQLRLQNLRVDLYDTSSHGHEALCDAAGRFAFATPFMPGDYTIEVLPVPDGFIVRDIRLGQQEISADGFEISASGQLEIVLSSAAGMIAGSAEDADGKPFPYSSVTLVPLDGRWQPSRTGVDGDGNFRFPVCGPANTGCSPGKKSTMTSGKTRNSAKSTKTAQRKSLSARGKHRRQNSV